MREVKADQWNERRFLKETVNVALYIKACPKLEVPFLFCNMQDRYNHRKLNDNKLGEFIPCSFYSLGPGNKASIEKCVERKIWVCFELQSFKHQFWDISVFQEA